MHSHKIWVWRRIFRINWTTGVFRGGGHLTMVALLLNCFFYLKRVVALHGSMVN